MSERVSLGYGVTTDKRTAKMLAEAERLAGFKFLYAQGSYNRGVGASAGTHDGGGTIDIRTIPMGSTARKNRALRALRRVGFAAWLRPYVAGVWGEHIHAVAIGCKDLALGAFHQTRAYLQGRDGLKGNRPDPQAFLGVRPTTWEEYLSRPVVRWSTIKRGTVTEIKTVQRALRRFTGRKIEVTGKWDRPTNQAWKAAIVKAKGRRRLTLLRFLGDRYGFRAVN